MKDLINEYILALKTQNYDQLVITLLLQTLKFRYG